MKGSATETFCILVSIARAGELRRGLSPRAKPELQSSIREDVTLPAVCQYVKVWILTLDCISTTAPDITKEAIGFSTRTRITLAK
jgi:hypothetical protein